MLRWHAETLGIPAYVLRYRLLPAAGLDEMVSDFWSTVREARMSKAAKVKSAIKL